MYTKSGYALYMSLLEKTYNENILEKWQMYLYNITNVTVSNEY